MADEQTENNIVLYAVGILSMLLAIAVFGFCVYIIPFVVFKYQYDVPTFIILVTHWYETIYELTGIKLALVILAPYLIGGAIFTLVARRLTQRVEEPDAVDAEFFKGKKSFSELCRPALFELVLVLTVLFLLFFSSYFIVRSYPT